MDGSAGPQLGALVQLARRPHAQSILNLSAPKQRNHWFVFHTSRRRRPRSKGLRAADIKGDVKHSSGPT